MKERIANHFFGLLYAIFILGGFAYGHLVSAEEISAFDSTIRVETSGILDVTETIQYDFGALERHGIFRTIPTEYTARRHSYLIGLSDISITNLDGKTIPFVIEKYETGKILRIGDKDKLVTGIHTYIIHYRVSRAVNYLDRGFDEIYWNATGNDWPISIASTSVTLLIPGAHRKDEIPRACYVGPLSAPTPCAITPVLDSANTLIGVRVDYPSRLEPKEGITVGIGVPVGVLKKAPIWSEVFALLSGNTFLVLEIFLPLITFIVMYALWRLYGKDPEEQPVIITEFTIPERLTPLEAGTLIDGNIHRRDIAAEIIYLAVKGNILIERIPSQTHSGASVDFALTLLKPIDSSGLNTADQRILNRIFRISTPGDKVFLSNLNGMLYADIEAITDLVHEDMERKDLWDAYTQTTSKKYQTTGLGITVLALAIFILAIRFGYLKGVFFGISVFLSGLIVFLFSRYMTIPTPKGIITKDHLKGLRKFLSIAEADRLSFHMNPHTDPKTFSAYLPYSMVLGVDKEWAEQFAILGEEVNTESLAWYSTPDSSARNAVYLIHEMATFLQVIASIWHAPTPHED